MAITPAYGHACPPLTPSYDHFEKVMIILLPEVRLSCVWMRHPSGGKRGDGHHAPMRRDGHRPPVSPRMTHLNRTSNAPQTHLRQQNGNNFLKIVINRIPGGPSWPAVVAVVVGSVAAVVVAVVAAVVDQTSVPDRL